MKRKIAAIMAADVAGYSRLVAEDEEETLRRLASYRSVFEEFVGRGYGRIFNTAGDSILAEFASAVEAVRCAIDVQESLRTRNLAYPPSRQMQFRIGITIGDVVERDDGDLLGDGVNIAARLEALADPGGIRVSRTVFEQVANKLSVQFADCGEHQVKNIPMPIQVYRVALEGKIESLPTAPPPQRPVSARRWILPVVTVAACVAASGIATLLYLNQSTLKKPEPSTAQSTPPPVAPKPEPPAAPRHVGDFVPEKVPLIPDQARATLRGAYFSAPDHKALAISALQLGFTTGQKDDEAAKAGALEGCQRASDALAPGSPCELYAVSDMVVYAHGRPPLPPQPWLTRDTSMERTFAGPDVPLVDAKGRAWIETNYVPAGPSKALALSVRGVPFAYGAQTSPEEAMRRSLELCGISAGAPCMIVALDDVFVVRIPTTMTPVAPFNLRNSLVAPSLREETEQRLASGRYGWSAVAVGADGRPGLALNATSEEEAVEGASAACDKLDQNCRIIAIGPFAVEPK
ncbi:MAG: adenylate/guanylate cyclase domain-containing protein [Xanthobacteraceae bacterium]